MKKPLISICIPTHNREKYLKGALESIISQINEKNKELIEICISDNCSEDNTEHLVRSLVKKSKVKIRYNKNPKNLGADMNFIKVVKMAEGEYCWFCSSDDELERGAIDVAIKKVKGNCDIDIFILNSSTYDIHLEKNIFGPSPLEIKYKRDYYFKDRMDAIKNVTSQLGYLSILMFKREKWLKVEGVQKFIGSAYVHVYILLEMIKSGSKVMFCSDRLIKYRFGNDSFLDELGIYRRHELDIKGYYNISAAVFGEYSKEHKAIINAFFDSNINMKMIGGIKLKRNRELTKKIYSLLFRYYKNFPKFWFTVVPFMLVPTVVYEAIANTFYKRKYQGQYIKYKGTE
ncbi:MAG: glycosyltransferase family A protein [Candidatus Woesearchaeota archaeon]